MNKFVQQLTASDSGIKTRRATTFGNQAKTAQEKLILELRGEKEELEGKMSKLEDLGPDTTISLKPVGETFDAATWVSEMQETKVALLEVGIRLEVAEKTLKEWFTDEEAAKA